MKKYIIKDRLLDLYLENVLCSKPRFTRDKKEAMFFDYEFDANDFIVEERIEKVEVIEYEEE